MVAELTTEAATGVVGQSVPRVDGDRFVRGQARYAADIHFPRQVECAFLRSPHPHARIVAIDVGRALALPGVVAVLTAADLEGRVGPHNFLWQRPDQHYGPGRCLAVDRVRFVGEALAVAVAEDRAIAEDALELIEVEYELLPVVRDIDEALADGAPLLHPDWGENTVDRVQWPHPHPKQRPQRVDERLAASAVVVRDVFWSQRVQAACMETRGTVVDYDAAGPAITVHTSTQSVHQVRESLSLMLSVPEHRIRVVAPDVGGAFGAKAAISREEAVVAHLALRLRRPVRWIEDRREAWTATTPARGQRVELELGFDLDGVITALRATNTLDMGSEPSPVGMGPVWVTGACMPGPYRVPGIEIHASAVVTNTPPVGSYRGFGQPEAIFPLERAIDEGARMLGLDPVEVRRRNLVEDDELPFTTPTRQVLDSGHYHDLLDLTLDRLDYPQAVADARRARAAGRFVGVGVAAFTESTNFGPTRNLFKAGIVASGWDSSTVRVEPDGHVRVFSSQAPMGQGIETVLAQSVADVLARPLDEIRVDAGDTLTGPYTGYASGGSRGAGIAGSSVTLAARKARAKLTAIAAHAMEVDADDVELDADGFAVRAVPGLRIAFAEVARLAYMAPRLPEGMEHGVEMTAAYDPPNNAFTYGHVAVVVELDPELGFVTIRRMVIGHDCGPQLNPAIVHGQVLGGAVQGIGVALFEELPYDADGQPRVSMMRDYLQPTAVDRPDQVEMVHLSTPSPYSLTGVKGVGESGVIATPVAIANAIQDAQPEGAPRITEMPVRPEWILDALAVDPPDAG